MSEEPVRPLLPRHVLEVSYRKEGNFEVHFTLVPNRRRPVEMHERLLNTAKSVLEEALADVLELLGTSHRLAKKPSWSRTEDTFCLDLGPEATNRERVVTQLCWDIAAHAGGTHIDTRITQAH